MARYIGTITAFEQYGHFLRFWGVTDMSRVHNTEAMIVNYIEKSANTLSRAQSMQQLSANTYCLAYHTDSKYYRAIIKTTIAQLVYAQSVDYGFEICDDFRNVLLFKGANPFKDIPPVAEAFIVAGVIVTGMLAPEEKRMLQESIVNKQVTIDVVTANEATGFRIASVYNQGGHDYTEAWLKIDKIQAASTVIQNQQLTFGQAMKSESLRQVVPSLLQHSSPMPSPIASPSLQPPISLVPPATTLVDVRLRGPPPPMVLPVGKTHNIIVSDATNGPWSFSVQLKEEEKLLRSVTDMMQRVDKVPIRAPHHIGRPCIAFHPIQKVYARAVLTSEGDRTATVTFTDFGDTDTVSLRELFEMPQAGLQAQQLSQKFRLVELPQIKPGTEDYQQLTTIFQLLVKNRDISLCVTRNEENSWQSCELYETATGISLKQFINDEKKKLKISYVPDTFPNVGAMTPVFISHVNNSKSFFVQKKERADECEKLQAEVQHIAKEAARLDYFRLNMPCIALFTDDQQWYRARLISEIHKKSGTVFFVDYGNETTTDISNLKSIPKHIAKIPTLALECSLDAELQDTSKLEDLLNEDDVSAKILSVNNNAMVVKILYQGVDIASPPVPPPTIPVISQVATAGASNGWDDRNSLSNRADGAGSDCDVNTFRSDRIGGGFRKRQEGVDDDDAGGTRKKREDGFKKYNENSSNGGFKKFGDDSSSGGFKKYGEDSTGGGFKKYGNDSSGGGFKKYGNDSSSNFTKFGDDNSGGGGGFRKRRDDDGQGPRSDRPTRTPIRFNERAPAGSVWTELPVAAGAECPIQVTYYITPDDFYVQSTVDRDPFVAMVEGIQTDYLNKFSFKKTEPPQVSDIVVAKFSEDRVLYRAEVTVAEPLTIRFVDYGNITTVTDGRDVYPVYSKLLDLPKQAVRCKLAGVKPAGGSWSSSANSYFDKEQMQCKFLGEDDGVQLVNLLHDGQDVAEQLTAAGLAEGATASNVSSAVTSTSSPSTIESPQFAYITPSLLVGDVALMHLPYVEGVDRFFVQPDLASITLMESCVGKAPKKQLVIDASKENAGCWCLALLNETLYRAQIVELTESGVLLQFVDYGDSAEIPINEVFELPDSLNGVPALAIECALYGDTTRIPDEAQDKFKEEYEQKDVVLKIQSIDDNRLIVTLYNRRGVKVEIEGWANDCPGVSCIPQLVLPASQMKVNVIELTGTNKCLISLPSQTQLKMNDFYEGLGNSETKVEIGQRCAVKCADGNWRRSVRTAEEPCFLLDVGRTEYVTEFQHLTPEFVGVPAWVREVTCYWPVLGEHQVKVTRDDDNIIIDPVIKSGFLSHIEKVSEIYIHTESIVKKVAEISEALSETSPGEFTDDLFAAKYPDDEQWYRAQVIDKAEPCKVSFVDYGNIADVEEMAPLSADLLKLPPLAKLVALEAGLPESTLEELTALLSDAESPLQLVEKDGKIVDILCEQKSVADKLLKRRPLKSGETVFISHVENPSHFYVQRNEDWNMLEDINAKLANADTFSPAENNADGVIVAAKYEEDDNWYRANVSENQVWFIDHGNSGQLVEVRALPAELSEIPPLALRVRIDHPSGKEWDQFSIDAMFELLDGRPLLVVEAVWRDNAYTVQLSSTGVNILNQLISETEQVDASNDSTYCAPDELIKNTTNDVLVGDKEEIPITTSDEYDSNKNEESEEMEVDDNMLQQSETEMDSVRPEENSQESAHIEMLPDFNTFEDSEAMLHDLKNIDELSYEKTLENSNTQIEIGQSSHDPQNEGCTGNNLENSNTEVEITYEKSCESPHNIQNSEDSPINNLDVLLSEVKFVEEDTVSIDENNFVIEEEVKFVEEDTTSIDESYIVNDEIDKKENCNSFQMLASSPNNEILENTDSVRQDEQLSELTTEVEPCSKLNENNENINDSISSDPISHDVHSPETDKNESSGNVSGNSNESLSQHSHKIKTGENVEDGGFNEDVVGSLESEIIQQKQNSANAPRRTIEEKIVPGAICRGVNLNNVSP